MQNSENNDILDRVKPKISRDDWQMMMFMVIIGAYLVFSLAFPLYAILSKSFENNNGAVSYTHLTLPTTSRV